MGFVLSFRITLGNKRSQERASLWAGGPDPVSVVLTGGLGALRLIWSETQKKQKEDEDTNIHLPV